MKKLSFLLILFIFSAHFCSGQSAEYVYRNTQDSSYNCYLVIRPDDTPLKGLIIRDYSSLPSNHVSSPYQWGNLALKNGLAIVYTVSSNYFPELYYDETGLILLDEIINEVVNKIDVPKQNIFIGGISASGTRALKYAQFCEQGKSKFGIKIRGVFSVDSPLDFERFYYSASQNQSNFKKGMISEAKLMVKVFPEKLGGTPEENLKNYQRQSAYSHSDPGGGDAKFLMKTSLIFFHEPDINWWIEERGATYYDINSFDIAGLYNYLKINEHQDVELISTSGKGFDRNGNRKCHSWTIVDEEYLIDWILYRISSE